jgi:hypothetical protein
MAQDDRVFARLGWAIDIRIEARTISCADGDVPVDMHAVEHFRFLGIGHVGLLGWFKTMRLPLSCGSLIDQVLFDFFIVSHADAPLIGINPRYKPFSRLNNC